MAYYRTIDGLYDGELIELAESIVQGNGGIIGEQGMDWLVNAYYELDDITEIHEKTIQYIKDNFNWDEQALITFNTFVR